MTYVAKHSAPDLPAKASGPRTKLTQEIVDYAVTRYRPEVKNVSDRMYMLLPTYRMVANEIEASWGVSVTDRGLAVRVNREFNFREAVRIASRNR